MATYLIKAEIHDPRAQSFVFADQPTMYGGKAIAAGDRIFLFASEAQGGRGLIAHGVVTAVRATPRRPGVERQTPCVTITVKRTALAKKPCGRSDLKQHRDWKDGRPESELNFKFYRQATNKIGGISEAAVAFLDGFF